MRPLDPDRQGAGAGMRAEMLAQVLLQGSPSDHGEFFGGIDCAGAHGDEVRKAETDW